MPTNTLGGVNLAALAEQSLDCLVDVLPRLQVFSTDFSADIASAGESVSTRVATQPTSASLATGYAANAQNSTTSAKTVTLGAVTGSVLGFSDAEWSKSNINLYDVFLKPGINAVANDMIDDVLAVITAANFGAAAFTGAAAGFDEDDVADIGKVLTDAKVPKGSRSLVLSTAYYNALLKRDAVKLAYAIGGTEAIRQGIIPNISGFQVLEYTDIPSNSENLVGFACAPQGIIIAARSPAVPANFPGEIMDVTEPDSGFTLQLRKWYSADDGQYYLSMAAMWGVAVGVAGNLKRIVSA
jgi:hypothetical protein